MLCSNVVSSQIGFHRRHRLGDGMQHNTFHTIVTSSLLDVWGEYLVVLSFEAFIFHKYFPGLFSQRISEAKMGGPEIAVYQLLEDGLVRAGYKDHAESVGAGYVLQEREERSLP